VNLYIKSTEHKTTRKPCEDFKAQVYHLGEYTGRAMDMLEEMEHGEADLIRNYGMKEAALREGLVYFSQMQCMQRVVLKYVRLPGPLLGVSTDAASLTCQGGETKLDKDEDKATLAIEKMITQWTQWLTSSGTDDAIRTRRMAERSATGPLAKIEPILDAVNEIIAGQGSYSTFRTLFVAIDTNSDGVITKQELKVKLDAEEAALAQDPRAHPPAGELTNLMQQAGLTAEFHAFEQIDANKDGKITLAEFVGALHVWD
jgi:hypothetical protein